MDRQRRGLTAHRSPHCLFIAQMTLHPPNQPHHGLPHSRGRHAIVLIVRAAGEHLPVRPFETFAALFPAPIAVRGRNPIPDQSVWGNTEVKVHAFPPSAALKPDKSSQFTPPLPEEC